MTLRTAITESLREAGCPEIGISYQIDYMARDHHFVDKLDKDETNPIIIDWIKHATKDIFQGYLAIMAQPNGRQGKS